MDSTYLPKHAPVLIIGTGTFGLSTALHLARRGFTRVTCLDRFPYPSPGSAGFDINKIVSMRNDTPVTARISREALAGWQEPLFENVWHEVGLITAGTSEDQIAYCRWAYEIWLKCGEEKNVLWLEKPEDFRELVPQLGQGPGIVPGWKGFFHRRAGWPAAKDAMRVVGDEAKRLGVSFVSGPCGTMKELLFDEKGKIGGIVAEDGTKWTGERIVMCTGAWTDSLLDTESQLEARCWTLAHIQLSEEECQLFKGQPILMNLDEGTCQRQSSCENNNLLSSLGFFFEPNVEGQIKFCNEFPGFTNNITLPSGRITSQPRSHAYHSGDSIPNKSREEIRDFITKTLPQFKDRPFVKQKICWCADTMDREWLISTHPRHANLILGTGDSGFGFKMLPTIGKYLSDLVEGKSIEPMLQDVWRWRPENRDRKTRVGGDRKDRDLKDMDGWNGETRPRL
jgi:sarcosine oxidase/L-pipecolate oxidase